MVFVIKPFPLQINFGASGAGADLVTLNLQTVSTTTEQTITGTSYSDLTSLTKALDGSTSSGMALCSYTVSKIGGSQNARMRWTFSTDGDQDPLWVNDSGSHNMTCSSVTDTLNSQTCKMQAKCNGASGDTIFQLDSTEGNAFWWEIS
jgi:hypothetical protein